MTIWTRAKSWLGAFKRAVINDPVLAALASRYVTDGSSPGPDQAARKVAVGSAVRLISNTISAMPVDAMRAREGISQPVPVQPMLLRDPEGAGRGFRDWAAQMAWALATRGNCFGHIVARDPNSGYPTTIVPIHPNTITPHVDKTSGVLTWQVKDGTRPLDADEVMHVRLFPVPGEVLGLSPIAQHAATIGLSVSAEQFGAKYFDAGGHPTALLTSPDPLSDTQAAAVKRKFLAATESREPVLMPDGIKYEQIQVTPEESQFLDTQKYTAAECARIFGPGMAEMLGYDTASAMTYQNVADRDLHLLKYTINTYLVALEDALSACLPNGQKAQFNRNSMLRMNPMDRARQYALMTQVGAFTPNTILQLEDMPPVAWGDKPYPLTSLKETETIGPDGAPVAPASTGGTP